MHQTYKVPDPDNKVVDIHCTNCDLWWQFAYDPEDETILYFDDKTLPNWRPPGYLLLKSGEDYPEMKAVRAGIAADLVRSDRPKMQELMDDLNSVKHHICINRDCVGLPGGICGVTLTTTITPAEAAEPEHRP